MLNVVRLNAVMMSVVMLNIVMLGVVAPKILRQIKRLNGGSKISFARSNPGTREY
jgi:hypothetical protein